MALMTRAMSFVVSGDRRRWCFGTGYPVAFLTGVFPPGAGLPIRHVLQVGNSSGLSASLHRERAYRWLRRFCPVVQTRARLACGHRVDKQADNLCTPCGCLCGYLAARLSRMALTSRFAHRNRPSLWRRKSRDLFAVGTARLPCHRASSHQPRWITDARRSGQFLLCFPERARLPATPGPHLRLPASTACACPWRQAYDRPCPVHRGRSSPSRA